MSEDAGEVIRVSKARRWKSLRKPRRSTWLVFIQSRKARSKSKKAR